MHSDVSNRFESSITHVVIRRKRFYYRHYKTILKTCFLDTICIVIYLTGSNFQPHTIVLSAGFNTNNRPEFSDTFMYSI